MYPLAHHDNGTLRVPLNSQAAIPELSIPALRGGRVTLPLSATPRPVRADSHIHLAQVCFTRDWDREAPEDWPDWLRQKAPADAARLARHLQTTPLPPGYLYIYQAGRLWQGFEVIDGGTLQALDLARGQAVGAAQGFVSLPLAMDGWQPNYDITYSPVLWSEARRAKLAEEDAARRARCHPLRWQGMQTMSLPIAMTRLRNLLADLRKRPEDKARQARLRQHIVGDGEALQPAWEDYFLGDIETGALQQGFILLAEVMRHLPGCEAVYHEGHPLAAYVLPDDTLCARLRASLTLSPWQQGALLSHHYPERLGAALSTLYQCAKPITPHFSLAQNRNWRQLGALCTDNDNAIIDAKDTKC